MKQIVRASRSTWLLCVALLDIIWLCCMWRVPHSNVLSEELRSARWSPGEHVTLTATMTFPQSHTKQSPSKLNLKLVFLEFIIAHRIHYKCLMDLYSECLARDACQITTLNLCRPGIIARCVELRAIFHDTISKWRLNETTFCGDLYQCLAGDLGTLQVKNLFVFHHFWLLWFFGISNENILIRFHSLLFIWRFGICSLILTTHWSNQKIKKIFYYFIIYLYLLRYPDVSLLVCYKAKLTIEFHNIHFPYLRHNLRLNAKVKKGLWSYSTHIRCW